MEIQFERNYYVSDETIKAKVKIDNYRGHAKCERLIIKIIKVMTLSGSNSRIYRSTKQVARAEMTADIGATESTEGFSKAIKLIISDADLKFDSLRDHKLRFFKPEDL